MSQSIDPLERLPVSLQCRLFSYLSATECAAVRVVSRAWYKFIVGNAPWGSLNLPCSIQPNSPYSSDCLISLTVDFDKINDNIMPQLESVLRNASNLESLVLLISSNNNACNRFVQPILERIGNESLCPNLRQLSIRGGPCNVTDEGVLALAKGCPKMRFVELHPTSRVTDCSLVAMATHWPELRSLCLLNCYGLTLGSGCAAAIGRLFESCVRLRRLRLAIGAGIKPTFFTRLGRSAKQLVHLRMEFIEGDQGFDSWAEMDGLDGLSSCSSLTSLVLTDCGRPGSNALSSLAPQLSALRHLRLKYGQEDCGGVDNGAATAAADSASAISCINDQLLIALAQHCPLLESLRLSSCRNITDAGLISLNNLKSLTRLTLRDCRAVNQIVADEGVTSASLASSIAACPRLARICINFSSNHRLLDGDQLIGRLSSDQARIVNLSLLGLVGIGDESLLSISQKFPNLHRLRLGSCGRVTRSGYQQFLETRMACRLMRSSLLELLDLPF